MKTTLSLFYEYSSKYRPRYGLHEMRNWTYKGSKMVFPKAFIPPEVKNVLKIEPEDMLKSTRYEEEIKRNTVINFNEFLNWKAPDVKGMLIDQDPNKKIERAESFVFAETNRFEMGETQAALLTKTKVMENSSMPVLPETELPHGVRQTLERFIYKANWWITDENKFPKRFVPRHHIYRNKAEFGILPKDTIRYMFNDLFHYSDCLSPSKEVRMFNKDHFIETFYYWKEQRIQFSQNRDFLISGLQMLPLFSQEPVKWSPEELSLEMGPIDPRMDLKTTKHYSPNSCDGWKSSDVKSKFPHIVTINIDLPSPHNDFLEPEARQITQSEKNAIAIMNCFAQAVATARRIHGDELVDSCHGRLPQPIAVQAISFDGVQFDFIYYQLNSVDLSSGDSANLAWIDAGHALFQKHYRSKSMLRNTRYENLDPEVFRKFLAFYRYGCV